METIIFSEGNIHVTTNQFVVGSQVYSLKGVISTKVLVSRMAGSYGCIGVGILGGIVSLFDGEILGAIFFSILLIGIGLLWRKLSTKYVIVLNTSSGEEIKAFTSRNIALIGKLHMALNQIIR